MTDALLTDRDLMAVLQVSRSLFYREKAQGRYRHLEVPPTDTGTSRSRYSPLKVRALVERRIGLYAPTFGRKAG